MPNLLDLVADNVAPGGDVIVVGYPNLIEEPKRWSASSTSIGRCAGVLSADAPMLRNVTAYLNQQLGDVVAAANARHHNQRITFHFLDIATAVYETGDDKANRHGLCSEDPWLNGVTFGNHEGNLTYTNRSFHPNQKGYTATGQVLADYLRNNFRFDHARAQPQNNLSGTGAQPQNSVSTSRFQKWILDNLVPFLLLTVALLLLWLGGGKGDNAGMLRRLGGIVVGLAILGVAIAGGGAEIGSWIAKLFTN